MQNIIQEKLGKRQHLETKLGKRQHLFLLIRTSFKRICFIHSMVWKA